MAVYYATKAFILHFSEAIANELEGTGVTVKRFVLAGPSLALKPVRRCKIPS